VALVQARIVDAADSPYAEAVASAKAVLRALDNNDLPSLRASARRLRSSLGGSLPVAATPPAASRPAVSEMTVTAPAADTATRLELQTELQLIEDLLTGTDAERREGLDKLHQMIRRIRTGR
jgi:hypothetical protein